MGNHEEDIFYAVSLFGCIVALFIVVFAGLVFIRKQNDSKSRALIKILFLISFVLVLFCLIFGVIENTIHFTTFPIHEQTFTFIHASLGAQFYVILLATLVFRLHITFKDSSLRMSTRTIYLFSILLIVCIIAAIVGIIGFQLQHSDFEQTVTIGRYLEIAYFLIYLPLYFIGSIAAVRYFVCNLSKLAKLRASSLRDVTVKEDEISLDTTQQRMVNVSAKYILLFCVAILSTLFTVMGYMFLHQYPALAVIMRMIWTFDFCLNLICLYLQFSFASEHYHTFCGCLDNICRKIVSKRTKRAIHRESR